MSPDGGSSRQVLYRLTLYVTGATPRSLQAVNNVRRFCDEDLAGQCDLEVVDLYSHPERASADQIVATPTLVRRQPAPKRYAIGDLSDVLSLRAAFGRN